MTVSVLCPQTVEAREQARQRIDIPASKLSQAIAELSRQAKVSIGMQGGLPSRPTPAIHGEMTVQQALRLLLRGTGFVARRAGPTAWRIEQAPAIDDTRSAQQVAASSPLPAPQPIVVTASKRDMALTDLPLAISVALLPSGESGTRDDTNSIAQAVEGLALTGAGPGRNRIFLRGIADSAFNGESQSTVAIVLDDARLTYAAPDPDIRLVDMERVEVLKGPQGSLYGTGALGGIYHLVSRRAQLDMLTAQMRTNASRFIDRPVTFHKHVLMTFEIDPFATGNRRGRWEFNCRRRRQLDSLGIMHTRITPHAPVEKTVPQIINQQLQPLRTGGKGYGDFFNTGSLPHIDRLTIGQDDIFDTLTEGAIPYRFKPRRPGW